jgi:hypothetical protein
MPSPMLPSRVARLPALLPGARKGGAQPNGAEPRPHVERESGANTAIKPSLPPAIGVALSAALITVRNQAPMVALLACASDGDADQEASRELRLPTGPLLPLEHDTLEHGVRSLVAAQTGIELGYTEQLYTFGEQRTVVGTNGGTTVRLPQMHLVSIGYLALPAAAHQSAIHGVADSGRWVRCYDILPWEDWRTGRPKISRDVIEPRLKVWADGCPHDQMADHVDGAPMDRHSRVDLAFGLNGTQWDEERALERHELLNEAGLLSETHAGIGLGATSEVLGIPLAFDHRRMLAMALGRLRAKIKNRPIVFDLMDETFTLFELQCTVQAILGTPLHKQNFRRLVEAMGLVEGVDAIRAKTGGRPARLYRFRPHVVLERSAPGVRIKSTAV